LRHPVNSPAFKQIQNLEKLSKFPQTKTIQKITSLKKLPSLATQFEKFPSMKNGFTAVYDLLREERSVGKPFQRLISFWWLLLLLICTSIQCDVFPICLRYLRLFSVRHAI
jgi:hypothetical protein